MAARTVILASAVALGLAGCSGGEDPSSQEVVDTSTVMTTPAEGATATDVVDKVTGEATPDAAETNAAAEETAVADDAKPAAEEKNPDPVKAAAAAPAATPEPVKVAEAGPPASYGRCAVCHTANKGGEDKLGPNLYGVFGSKAGQGGFAYSDALQSSGLTWDEATLHSWLENPRALVPGNRMSFPGIKDQAKRQEIIDYLKKQR